MIRLGIGGIAGGIVQWLVGFLFWGTPLSAIPFKVADDAQNAAVQTALAQNLTPHGTGTYYIPWPDTPQGTVLHGRGPVAMIHFNTSGFPATAPNALVAGLILSIVTIFLLAMALWFVGDRVRDFASRAKLVVLFAVAAGLYFTIGEPIYNPYMPWPYFLYLGIANILGLAAGGLVVARWFVRREAWAPPR